MQRLRTFGIIVMLPVMLASCASLPDNLVSAPQVRLTSVQIAGLGFRNQNFILAFDVSNPNAIALPIRSVSYGIRLDGQRFASGETVSDFRVPANGSSEFAISVDLDLLSTAPQLLTSIRDGAQSDIAYELDGRFGVDLPLVPELKFNNRGRVALDGSTTSLLR